MAWEFGVTLSVRRLAALLCWTALLAVPSLAQDRAAPPNAAPTCPFLECSPEDSKPPLPAVELAPSQQSPKSAPSRPSAPGTPKTPVAPIVAEMPSLPAKNCARLDFGIVCTSSILPKWRTVTYGPANMFDGQLDTAWVEGVEGVGVGEQLTIAFDEERLVSGISLLNGYHKSNDLFAKNGRITEIYLDTSDGQKLDARIADDAGEQVLSFDRPVRLKWLSIQIADAVAGTKYTDTAISELRVLFE